MSGVRVMEDVDEMRAFSRGLRARGSTVVLVPTMGFLHDGHRELLRAGKKEGGKAGSLILSIFVNPIQFGPKEDFESYPRNLENDLRIAGQEGVEAVFAPRPAAMYPEVPGAFVEVEGLSDRLCGVSRPGHFRGVATVVCKLFNIVLPHKALFGEKDYQQLLIIRRMVRDLNLDVEVIGIKTVRESDGLAMSSRNSYLNPAERKAALCVPRSMEAAVKAVRDGLIESSAIIDRMKKIIEKEPSAVVEYIKICDPETLEEVGGVDGPARLFLAVRIGRARLIDNCGLQKNQ